MSARQNGWGNGITLLAAFTSKSGNVLKSFLQNPIAVPDREVQFEMSVNWILHCMDLDTF